MKAPTAMSYVPKFFSSFCLSHPVTGLPKMPVVYSSATTDELSQAVAKHVAARASAAIAATGRFTCALSGGSLPKLLAAVLKDQPGIDWSKWYVFFADERVVPLDHADSNYLSCSQELFSKVPIPADQIFPIKTGLSPEDTAKEYIASLKSVFGDCECPAFDCIFLGMGPDGHTCSLFPGHPLLDERSTWIASILDSPKPPPERITFTWPVLEAANEVCFISAGAGKADMLKMVLEDDIDWKEVPCKNVKCKGQVVWFVDDGATAKLEKTPKLKYP